MIDSPWLAVALALTVPPLVAIPSGLAMMRLTGRAQFRRTRKAPQSNPLNYRLGGYRRGDAEAYWSWLGSAGRAAERRFLWADMFYPLIYGGAFAGSLLMLHHTAQLPGQSVWWLLTVMVGVLGDWVENSIHLWQLGRHERRETIDGAAILVASLGTQVKWVGVYLSIFLILGLALWMSVTLMLGRQV